MPKYKNWNELKAALQKSGITVEFRHNGDTDKIQGVRFNKNDYGFNGSKVDRMYSYSKIDWQLQQNDSQQQTAIHQPRQSVGNEIASGLSSVAEAATSVVGGLFNMIQPSSGYDENEIEAQKKQAKIRKKKKGQGRKL